MKKIITAVTALIAMSVAFMSCGFTDGAAVADYGYKEFSMDLSSYELDSSKVGSFTISGNELVASGMNENAKIIITYNNIETKTPGLKLYFGNLTDDSGKILENWCVYHDLKDGNKIYYDIEENKLASDEWGVVRGEAGENSIVLKLNKADFDGFSKRGLVIQGTDSIITAIKMMYIGDDVIVTNIKDFSKDLPGTLTSKIAEVELDKEDANISVLNVTPESKIGTSLKYDFTGAADLSKYKEMIITLKTPYKYELDSNNNIVKKSTFKMETDMYTARIVYNFYSFKVSDGKVKATDGSTIPDGAIYINESEGSYIAPLYIQMICPEFKGNAEGKDYAYVNVNEAKDLGNAGEDISKIYKYESITNKNHYEGYNWTNEWCCKYVYTEKVTSDVPEKRATAEINKAPFVTIYSTKDNNTLSSTYSITNTSLAQPEYKEIKLPLKDFTSKNKADLSKLTGYSIDLNKCEGTVFIKSIIFE